jgi:membrane peptidoglycan carboxypeptidase
MRTQGKAPAEVPSPRCPYCGAPTGDLTWEAPLPGRPGMARRRRHRFRRIRRFLAVTVALGILGGIMLAGLLIVTPPVSNAPALVRALDHAHHAVYPGPPVPERFAASLVATEDHRFYSEAGIDPLAIVRVGLGYLSGKPGQGGSTLYQQLARMLYTPGHVGVLGEAEQVLLGIKLSFSYSRAEVLDMYAGAAYFGHGYYGLQAASCGYFGLAPDALSWPQAALLAGLIQIPTADDPLTHGPSLTCPGSNPVTL